MEVEEELYLQGQLLWAQVSPACWRVSQHLALVEIRGEIKLTTDCQHGVFSHGRKAAGHPALWGATGCSAEMVPHHCLAAFLQAETKRRMAGMEVGSSGLSNPSQSQPRCLLSFLPQPVVTSLTHFARCFWCEHLLPAAGWCSQLLLVLRKNLWYQNISLPLYDQWSLGMRQSVGYPELRVTSLKEVEPPPCVSPRGLHLHLLQVFLSCAVPFPVVFQHHLQLGCRTLGWAQLPLLPTFSEEGILSRLWDSFRSIFCPPLFSQHPFRNWTADLPTACCITAFASGSAGTELTPLLLPDYCCAPHSIPLAVFAMLLCWESSPAVCFTIIGFITSLTKPQSNLKLC